MEDKKPAVTGRGRRWKGPHEPMTPEQQRLSVQWIDMAMGHARSWAKTRPHLKSEFISASMFALVEAARNYDPTLNRTFYTYLRWHLRHARKEVIRNSIPKGYRITGCLRIRRDEINKNRPKMLGLDGHQEYTLGFTSGSVEDYDMMEWVKYHLAKISTNHTYVITQIYWYGRNAQEIAGEMGCSRTDVINMQNEALNALRQIIEDEGDVGSSPNDPEPAGVVGSIIKIVRESQGVSQEQLASMVGVDPGVVARIEADEEKLSRAMISSISRALSQDEVLFLSMAGYEV